MAQEPRVMASLCGEKGLIDGYNLRTPEFPKGKDFYAILASAAFKKDYWECTEFDREGHYQAEGKARRQEGKVIQLGVAYGMGPATLVKQLNAKKKPDAPKTTVQEGREIMDNFFGQFTILKTWKDYCRARLYELGYMETIEGRRRRLFDIFLPDFTVKAYKSVQVEDIFFSEIGNTVKIKDSERTAELQKKINLEGNSFKAKDLASELAKDPMVSIRANGGFKSKTLTQSVNYCIQGTAAGLTKRALVALYHHPEKERLGLEILAPVHDEILAEAFVSERKEALEVLADTMAHSADGLLEVKMVGDGVIESSWNLGHFTDKIQKDYKKAGEDLQVIFDNNPEVDQAVLERMALGTFNPEIDRIEPRKA